MSFLRICRFTAFFVILGLQKKRTVRPNRDYQLMTDYKEDLENALRVLRSGGIILYPTDTIWGIGCDATNPAAVAKVYALKQRSETKSMLVLVASTDDFSLYSESVPDVAVELAELSERPCTVVLDNAVRLAPNLISTDGTIGLRATRDPFSRDLCRALRRPLVSTSANISGSPSPATFGEIDSRVKEGVDYIVEWRRNDTTAALPSSVVKIAADGQFRILRQ